MDLPSRRFGLAVLPLLLLAVASLPSAQPQATVSTADAFTVQDVMIPARDGVRLHTKIFTPKNQTGPLPILMRRTPYGIEGAASGFARTYRTLAEEGYIFAVQDIRGKFGSEGTFVMQRPARAPGDTTSLDEGTDTYDTIEWLLKNVPNHNGRVGMLGVSYDGWTTIMGALEPHPALKAISPQASPADMWLGDDFHHNGAFRLSYAFEYAAMMESGKDVQQFQFDRYDTFDWYLDLGPLANANRKYLFEKIPTWNDYVAHPDYDQFWRRQTLVPHLRGTRVPTLNVAGWWDQEDFYGPLRIYETLEQHDASGMNYLVVGPWNHGGWNRAGTTLGPIPFGSDTAEYFRDRVQAPFFAYFLKDKGTGDFPEALTFEAGSNQWRRWDTWPPQTTTTMQLVFGPGETLIVSGPGSGPSGTGAPAIGSNFDEFVSDPEHPVPYRHRPIQATYFPGGSAWSTWLVEDQRFVDDRPDVLSWETAPLDQDLTIAGEIVAHLFASTTGSDADWIVKLIDVYPEDHPENWTLAGYQLMVSNEVFRGRYRQSFEQPSPIRPGQVEEYRFSLHTQNYTFRKGHRVMVQVQSTWFPLIDRNPQTFTRSIFEARDEDFVKATHRVYRTPRYPSRVDIPVVGAGR
ncbi:MAG: CocE/NonD family hydrolase [Acidobacteriota bacterium]|nr:CocE/NonD family hydrolase [Acidobacteriota bacterium]